MPVSPTILSTRLAAELASIDAFLAELALDDDLRRDAGVVHPREPKGLLALHPGAADERVLERPPERVTDVQPAGHVRWRDDDAVRLPAPKPSLLPITPLAP